MQLFHGTISYAPPANLSGTPRTKHDPCVCLFRNLVLGCSHWFLCRCARKKLETRTQSIRGETHLLTVHLRLCAPGQLRSKQPTRKSGYVVRERGQTETDRGLRFCSHQFQQLQRVQAFVAERIPFIPFRIGVSWTTGHPSALLHLLNHKTAVVARSEASAKTE